MTGFLIGLAVAAGISLLRFLPHPWKRVQEAAGGCVWRKRGFRWVGEIAETGIREAPFRWWTREPYGNNGTIAHSGFADTLEAAQVRVDETRARVAALQRESV